MYVYFSAHPWTVVPLNASEPALDMFLVLTGFLATLTLVPALEAASSPGPVVARCVPHVREHLCTAGLALSWQQSTLCLCLSWNASMCYGAHRCCMHMMMHNCLPAGGSGRLCQHAACLLKAMQELASLKRLPLLPLRETRYLWRRALRILPAFYSALALVRLLAVPLARHPSVPEEVKCAPAVSLALSPLPV